MTRAAIEALKHLGLGWDPNMPGPIADSRFNIYEAPDGTRYAILISEPKWRSLNTEPWKEFDP